MTQIHQAMIFGPKPKVSNFGNYISFTRNINSFWRTIYFSVFRFISENKDHEDPLSLLQENQMDLDRYTTSVDKRIMCIVYI